MELIYTAKCKKQGKISFPSQGNLGFSCNYEISFLCLGSSLGENLTTNMLMKRGVNGYGHSLCTEGELRRVC